MFGLLVLLGFFALLGGFPLLRREMIHRHLLERLKLEHGETAALPAPLAGADDAPALALRLPEPYRLYALALLCRLQDAESADLEVHTRFLLRQARHEYLPQTLRSYLNVTPAVRTSLAAQRQDADALLREQLQLISQGVADALGQDDAAARQLLTQGAFLRDVFPAERPEIRV